jgi:hypothetical protein
LFSVIGEHVYPAYFVLSKERKVGGVGKGWEGALKNGTLALGF